jgi:hypothetical protein
MLRLMGKRARIWRLMPLACVLLLALSPGCGGKAAPLSLPVPTPAAPQPPAGDGVEQPGRNLLSTSMPALTGLSAGAGFEFVIRVKCTDTLYQGSGRVLYDPGLLQPVAVVRGQAIPASFLFSSKLDAAPVTSDGMSGLPPLAGVVPFAFTGLPDAPGQAATAGELCRIKFRLLRQAGSSSTVRLLNDAAYLQLRGPTGNRLAFDLQAEVALQ